MARSVSCAQKGATTLVLADGTTAGIRLVTFRPQSQDETAPTVSTQVPDGIPVSFQSVRANASNTRFNGLTYSIRNDGGTAILAQQVWWDLYFGSQIVRIPTEIDSWLAPEKGLAPGATEELDFRVSAVGKVPLTKIVGTVAYVEFADNSRMGPAVATIYPYFRAGRREEIVFYSRAMQVYRSQGFEALARLLPADLHDDINTAAARGRLRFIYKQSGVGGVVAELESRLAANAALLRE